MKNLAREGQEEVARAPKNLEHLCVLPPHCDEQVDPEAGSEQAPLSMSVFDGVTAEVKSTEHRYAPDAMTGQGLEKQENASSPEAAVSSHRSRIKRLMLSRVLAQAFLERERRQRKAEREKALQALVEDAEELGLYDIGADEFQEAVAAARKGI